MKIGVCYYPEHWPESQWQRDARHMREIGITVVRVGEFSWQQLEPEPGAVNFDWLQRAMDVLHAEGLGIVLGTPTATPPKWLVDTIPDMLAIDQNGQPRCFGSRRHYCFSSAAYLTECKRIVELMATELGRHEGLVAWQTDNEYGCHNTCLSYSRNALLAFRDWCSRQYSSIEELNTQWGNAFWSMAYRNFSEIDLPCLTVTEANPSHQLAFWKFSSWQIKQFNKAQTDILRKHSPGIPVSHNFMGNFVEFDHHLIAEDLDIATWDSYPLGFLDRDGSDPEEQLVWMRSGHPDTAAFHHDLYRGLCGGRWWVMEQQPGPVNWAPHNPAPHPGMARLWGLEAFAHGAEVVSYFRWRQAPFAQELMHTGILLSNGDEDIAADELRRLREDIERLLPEAGETNSTSPVAIVFDYPSDCALRIQRPGGDAGLHGQVGGRFDPLEWTQQVYSALRQLGQSVDIVSQQADLSPYSLVVVACAGIAESGLLSSLEKTNATVLILPRSGSRTADGTIPDNLPPGLLQALIPLQVTRTESLLQHWQAEVNIEGLSGSADRDDAVAGNTVALTGCDWREQVRTTLRPSGEFADGWGFHYQQANYHYLNTWLDKPSLRLFMQQLLLEAGLNIIECPQGLRLRRCGRLHFAINYGPDTVNLLDLPGLLPDDKSMVASDILLGSLTIQCSDAAVWLV